MMAKLADYREVSDVFVVLVGTPDPVMLKDEKGYVVGFTDESEAVAWVKENAKHWEDAHVSRLKRDGICMAYKDVSPTDDLMT